MSEDVSKKAVEESGEKDGLRLTKQELLGFLRSRGSAPDTEIFRTLVAMCELLAERVEAKYARDDSMAFEAGLVANLFSWLVTQVDKDLGDAIPIALRIPSLVAHIFPPQFALEVIKLWEERLPVPD